MSADGLAACRSCSAGAEEECAPDCQANAAVTLLERAGFVRCPWPSEEWFDAEGSGLPVPEWSALELARGDL
jgi:hypothetical protein